MLTIFDREELMDILLTPTHKDASTQTIGVSDNTSTTKPFTEILKYLVPCKCVLHYVFYSCKLKTVWDDVNTETTPTTINVISEVTDIVYKIKQTSKEFSARFKEDCFFNPKDFTMDNFVAIMHLLTNIDEFLKNHQNTFIDDATKVAHPRLGSFAFADIYIYLNLFTKLIGDCISFYSNSDFCSLLCSHIDCAFSY